MLRSSLLTQLDYLPEGLLEARAEELYQILPGPTLIHLQGRIEQPLFVSVLQHGNETTGLMAIQEVLKKYTRQALPRSLSFFIGNIRAAKHGQRHLDDQPDYNRVWPGTEAADCPEAKMMQAIVDEMAKRHVFASIDIHNNTGLNPHYACVNKLDHRFLQLAVLFGRLIVYFLRPKGVQSAAFAQICPAVTLECGKPGQRYGIQHALEYVDSCLHLSRIPDHAIAPQDIDLFHTVAQVNVDEHLAFSFQDKQADFVLNEDLNRMNFTEIAAGTVWGTLRDSNAMPILVRDEGGKKVTEGYFTVENHRLILSKKVMPSMLTLDEHIIRQDCLCYLMERIHYA